MPNAALSIRRARLFLEAYFDRRFPGWREYAQGDGDTRTRTQTGAMSKEEAYQVLGLQPGASLDEIREAYRRLMKKLHPDQGGTAHPRPGSTRPEKFC